MHVWKMHGKKDQEYIKKGPWKEDEDEVLLNHVKKYGPRDWSSIRSKGLLQRTGKSCRLRWVNKLQPNLKNGCKFSLEEERVVIELQAQFGNKWAKIASCLTGRTDNDVKNFWSSRKKRLARILQTPSATTPKSQKIKTKAPSFVNVPTFEAPRFISSSEGESSSKHQTCSLPFIENSEVIKMVSLPDLIKSELPSYNTNHVSQEFTLFENYKSTEHIDFPTIPELQNDLTFSLENQGLLTNIDEPCFIEDFGPLDSSDFGTFFEPPGSCRIGTRDAIDNSKSFFDDFPVDMFDHMDPPASPSNL